jgi:hypothetical protein
MHHYCGGHVAATAAAALLSPTLASPICAATAPGTSMPHAARTSRLDQHKNAKDTHRGEVEVLCEDPVCVGEARRTASGRHGSAGQELRELRLAAGGGQAGRFAHGFLKMIFWLRSAARLRCFLGALSAMLGAARSVQGAPSSCERSFFWRWVDGAETRSGSFFLPPCQACLSVVLGPGRGRGKRSRGQDQGAVHVS